MKQLAAFALALSVLSSGGAARAQTTLKIATGVCARTCGAQTCRPWRSCREPISII